MTDLENAVATARKLRPRTRLIYRDAVTKFIDFAGDDPKKWTKETVEKWRDNLGKALSPQTANLNLRGLKYASKRYAQLQDKPDFAHPVQVLSGSSRPRNQGKKLPLKPHDVRKLLATCQEGNPIDLRDRAMIVLGFRTGLRRTSIVGIEFSSFAGTKLTVPTRAGNQLTITIDDETRKAIQAWEAWLRRHGVSDGPLFRALVRPRVNGDVTVNPHALSADGLVFTVKSRAKKAGLDVAIYPDVFRYTFEAWCETEGIPKDRVKAVTGTKTPLLLERVGKIDSPIGYDLPALL